MAPEFVIRRVNKNDPDIDDVIIGIAIVNAKVDAEATDTMPAEEHALWRIDRLVRESHYGIGIALKCSEVVGYWCGFQRDDEPFSSWGIYVDPDHRRQHIGEALKSDQLSRAKELGCIKSVTIVEIDNVQSIAMLQKMGAQLILHKPGDKYYDVEFQLGNESRSSEQR